MDDMEETGEKSTAFNFAKKSHQQTLIEEQKRLNRLVQDQRRSVGRIRIPSQLERWTKVKEELGLTSHEDVAKLLLDSFDKVQEIEEQCIQVSKDTMATFDDFKVKVRMNADGILQFFMSLGVLPGQQVIGVDDDLAKTFETLKAKLALSSTQLMKYLFDLYEGSGMAIAHSVEQSADTLSMNQTVRQAVREEIVSLIRDGVLPNTQTQYQATLTRGGMVTPGKHTTDTQTALKAENQFVFIRQAGYQHISQEEELGTMKQTEHEMAVKEDGLVSVTEKGDQNGYFEPQTSNQRSCTPKVGAPSPLNQSSTSEAGNKRRSRKSQPQRVVVEAEDPVIDGEDMDEDEDDLQLIKSINGNSVKPQMINTLNCDSSVSKTAPISLTQPQFVVNKSPKGSRTNVIGVVETGTINLSSIQELNQTNDGADDSSICYNSPEALNSDGTSFFCPYCTYRTPIIARLKRHMTLHTGKVYKCTKCEKSYTEEYKLREHFRIKHEKSVHFVCEICKRDFTSKGGLKYHTKTMHRKEFDFWCDACCKGFKDSYTYETHIEIKHNRQPGFRCNNCSNFFKSLANLTMHKKACLGPNKKEKCYFNRFPCEICPERFASFYDLKQHSNAEHSDVSRYRCSCGLEFKLRASYNGHRHNCRIAIALENEAKAKGKSLNEGVKNVSVIDVESLNGNFEAKSLNFGNQAPSPVPKSGGNSPSASAKSDESLASIQITNLESGEQFTLSDKEKNDSRRNSPRKQLGVASPKSSENAGQKSTESTTESVTVHCCDVCDYKTPKLSHIKRHRMIHTGKKYKCDQCPKSFNEKNKLKVHMNSKHKGHAKYKCEVCYRTFSSKGGIVYHMQTKHNNTHKYKCEVCEKGFNQLQHYMGHKNTHSGIRPYVCDLCNQGFSYPSVLTSHRRICKGKKEEDAIEEVKFHPCSFCGEKFIMQYNLEDHIKKEHSNENSDFDSVLCDCGIVFTTDALKEHKPTCPGATVSQMFIKTSAEDVAMETSDENSDMNQISPEKFNLIVSQPVFPT